MKLNYDQPKEEKYCKDCLHFSSYNILNSCWHEKNLGHKLVIGVAEAYHKPYNLRNDEDLCGREGKWWEKDES